MDYSFYFFLAKPCAFGQGVWLMVQESSSLLEVGASPKTVANTLCPRSPHPACSSRILPLRNPKASFHATSQTPSIL